MRPDARPEAKRRKPSRKALTAKADRLFSVFVRERDKVCQAQDGTCWGGLQCAHLITRNRRSTRWDPENAVALCQGHHMRWTVDPAGWFIWCDDRIGSIAFMELYRRSQAPWDKDLDAVLERLNHD